MKKLLLLLALMLAACTGTSEPPLDLLLASGDGDQVVFYQPGPANSPQVGSWNLGQAVVDLARPEGESRLWVLTADALRAYPLSGGSPDQPPPQSAPAVDLAPGGDCSQGTLRSGENALLLDCGAAGVWTVPLAAPQLQPLDTSEDAPDTLYLLGPGDLLTRVAPTADGFELRYPGPGEGYHYNVSTTAPVTVAAAWAEDLLYIAVDDGQSATLYTWRAESSEAPKPSGNPLGLGGVRLLLPFNDGVILGGAGGYAVRRNGKDDLLRATPVASGLVSPNLYAYLAGSGRLLVLDLLDGELAEHQRSFPAAPHGLVYLPVGQ